MAKYLLFNLIIVLFLNSFTFAQKQINLNGATDYVNVGNMGARPTQGTITFWAKTNVLVDHKDVFTTCTPNDCVAGNSGIRFELHGDGTFFILIGGDVTTCVSGFEDYQIATMATNTWYHVAAVWNTATNNITAYLNGVQVVNETHTLWPTNFNDVYIGVGWGTSRSWNGAIDQVTMWKRALTASEINTVKNNLCDNSDADLVAWWNFNSNSSGGAGQTVLNSALSTSGSYNGTTIGGGVTFTSSTIPVVPNCIYLVSPANDSTNTPTTMNFTWTTGINTIDNYEFQLFTDTTSGPVVEDVSLLTPNKTVSSLLYFKDYWWRVRAKNTNGYCSYTPFNHFKTVNLVGISQINNEIPENFSMSQNFPNPFNPATKIKFDIPIQTNTRITVYDMLGKELSILFNKELNPGSYEILWNSQNLPSGVYFYQLQAGSYRETKRMLLVK